MTVYAIVKKLVGPIEPIGESNSDEERLDNLKEIIELVDRLIDDIELVARNKDRAEYSMKLSGDAAWKYMRGLTEFLKERY